MSKKASSATEKPANGGETVFKNPMDPKFAQGLAFVGELTGELAGDTAGAVPGQDAIEQLQVAEVSSFRTFLFTLFTFAKLVGENGFGVYFLQESIDSCGEMQAALAACVGGFEECVINSMLAEHERDGCALREDSNAEYAGWAEACTPRADAFVAPVIYPAALSLGLTALFFAQGLYNAVQRVRHRSAPKLKWSKMTEPELRALNEALALPTEGAKSELVARLEERLLADSITGEEEAGDDTPTIVIVHGELEMIKIKDTVLEIVVFICAMGLFVQVVQPMLLRKMGLGCGGSFCPNDMVAMNKNVRCDEGSIWITGSHNCTSLWTMDHATECATSGPTEYGCCFRIDLFFPCKGLSTCQFDVCDVTESAHRAFNDMYLFNAVEDGADLMDTLFTIWGFKVGLASVWEMGKATGRTLASRTFIVIFLLILVSGMIATIPVDETTGVA